MTEVKLRFDSFSPSDISPCSDTQICPPRSRDVPRGQVDGPQVAGKQISHISTNNREQEHWWLKYILCFVRVIFLNPLICQANQCDG